MKLKIKKANLKLKKANLKCEVAAKAEANFGASTQHHATEEVRALPTAPTRRQRESSPWRTSAAPLFFWRDAISAISRRFRNVRGKVTVQEEKKDTI